MFNEFGITASTLGNPPLRELVEACSAAQLTHLSIWPMATYYAARRDGWSDRDIRALLADHNLRVHDADAVVLWVGADDPGPPYFEEALEPEVFTAAEALGAPYVNVLLTGKRQHVTLDAAAEALAGVCDRAAARGLAVTVEFATRSAVNDVASAARVIELSGRRNAGICLDTWAVHFGDRDPAALASAGPLVHTIQLDDAPAERPADFAHATRYARLVPGDGAIDYKAVLGSLAAGGCRAPVIVEVFNDALLAAHGVEGFARHCAAAARLAGC